MENFPLIKKYPKLKGLPFTRIGSYPTPVEEIKGLGDARIFIKRDDLTGTEYGGNKIRKLEFALGDAKEAGATDVITYGCDGSNHALATGIYAGKLGMASHSILRTQQNARYVRDNLKKSAYYGINLYHRENLEQMDGLLEELTQQLKDDGKTPYYIPVGGTSPLGTVGFVNAAFELAEQIQAGVLPKPDFIYVADGTNGTAAGLMLGFAALGSDIKVIPVRVNDESRVNAEAISKLIDDTVVLLKSYDPNFPEIKIAAQDVPLLHDFFGGEYALFTREGMDAVNAMQAATGIKIEGTYTGKAFAALLDAAKKQPETTLLFWNTLNSRKAPEGWQNVDYKSLPEGFRMYFETDVQPLDK